VVDPSASPPAEAISDSDSSLPIVAHPKRILADIDPPVHERDVGSTLPHRFRVFACDISPMIGKEVCHFMAQRFGRADARQIAPDADFSPCRMPVAPVSLHPCSDNRHAFGNHMPRQCGHDPRCFRMLAFRLAHG